MILVLGKAKSHRVPNLGCSGAESPRWFDVSTKNSAWNIMHEWACCHEEAANHQLPTASAFWIIWIVSFEECSSLMQNLMQIHCSICSVILNAMATQYTGSLIGVYHPHWLVQWSHHCSCMCIPVHSPWLSPYIDASQMVLIILTMAGLFPDRPLCVCAHSNEHNENSKFLKMKTASLRWKIKWMNNSTWGRAEDNISEFEDILVKTTQNETPKQKRLVSWGTVLSNIIYMKLESQIKEKKRKW